MMDTKYEVVISGISGRLPECENVEEFMDSLIKGIDLVTENSRRFKAGFRGTPKRSGTIAEVNKFDNIFFGIPHSQVDSIDPRHRILLETVYESIVDAGVNPLELRGTKTGVYVGLSCIDSYGGKENVGRGSNILGALAANRISFAFDFKGPSYVCDTACSTSFYVLINAFKDLQSGHIDNAIVATTNINFDAYETAEYCRAGILSPEGYCRTFCIGRNGYVRSEAVISFLLQKKENSKRIYATIVGANLNTDGYKKQGFNCPSSQAQVHLMQETFEQFNISVEDVEYFEAHGTGTVVGDESECQALTEIYEKKSKPLLIGSVKSNMGHAEISAGLCSVLKGVTLVHTGTIPATLLHSPLDTSLPGLKEGKLKVVTENINFKDGLIGLNSFGFGGANGHIVLKPYTKLKIPHNKPSYRLAVASGRTAESVERFLDGIEKYEHDEEFLAMVDEIHKSNIDGHIYRGSMICGRKQTKMVQKTKLGRPIWFVYSGIGSQWTTMGKDLLKIKLFKDTFDRCATSLKAYDFDLYHVVTSEDPSIFHDIMNCYVGINAIQIALTELLRRLCIEPTGYIGHSLGELACAYADGSLTPEEAVLLSFARGYGFRKAKNKIIQGQMVAVGLSYDDITPLLPRGLYVACRNSSTCVTIAGPKEETIEFSNYLTSKGIFAKPVDSCGLALHTKYTEEASFYSFEMLKMIFKNKIPRSSKWVSSSVTQGDQKAEWSNYNCPEYHYNNFRNTVQFEEALKQIPKDAIVIEVSSHGLLQSILKRELGPDVTNIAICDRNCDDNEYFLLTALGSIYTAGGLPQLRKLYPDVKFPVSRGTPLISPLIKWDHNSSWNTPNTNSYESYGGIVTVNLSKPEYSDLKGHGIYGMICMSGASYVKMVWKIFAEEFHFKSYENVPIVVENLLFKRLTTLPEDDDVDFFVNIVRRSGNFEIYESGSLVCSGTIKIREELPSEFEIFNTPVQLTQENLILKRNDIYKFFNLKGQLFKNHFKSILECSIDGSEAKVEWKNNFECFMENMLQLSILAAPNYSGFYFSSLIKKIVIDPQTFFNETLRTRDMNVTYETFQNAGNIRTEGIAIFGHEIVNVFTKPRDSLVPHLETKEFIYFQNSYEKSFSISTAMSFALQIIQQNCLIRKPKICEIVNSTAEQNCSLLKSNLEHSFCFDIEYEQIHSNELSDKIDILIFSDSILVELNGTKITDYISENSFLIYNGLFSNIEKFNLEIIFQCNTEVGNILLLRPKRELKKYNPLEIQNDNLDWLHELTSRKDDNILLYSHKNEYSGIIGLTHCLLKENINVRSLRIDDEETSFDLDEEFYKNQLRKDLIINVLKNGKWGTYVHIPVENIEGRAVADASVSIKTVGDLSSLIWQEAPVMNWFEGNSEIVHICYSGLNVLDVLYATGKYHPSYFRADNLYLGCEFSGLQNGKKVMGITHLGGIGLKSKSLPHFIWEVPERWSLQEAATVPFAYALSYYALFLKSRLEKGNTILILNGADSVGMATISIAFTECCEVFVTISNEKQKNTLKQAFPQLKHEHIGYLSGNKLNQVIMANTNRRGVDLIMNCMTGDIPNDLITPVFKCLADNGRYIEMYPNNVLSVIGGDSLIKNYTFDRILPDVLICSSEQTKLNISEFIKQGLRSNVIKPLPQLVFSGKEVQNAFRCLESEQNEGKVIIEITTEKFQTASIHHRRVLAVPKLYFNPNKSFIIVGGTDLIGLEVTDWLIRRGARKIVLNLRKIRTTGYQVHCLHKWSQYVKVIVEIAKEDVTTLEGSSNLIAKARNLGSVGGVFIMTAAENDINPPHQSIEDFNTVFKSVLTPSMNMDKLTRKHCLELEYFVIFSSIFSGYGVAGQSSLGMAHSANESLCERRRKEGLPGLAIRWGPVNETGSVDDFSNSNKYKEDFHPQSIASCLEVLEKLMLQFSPLCTSYVIPERSKNGTKVLTPLDTVALILGIKNLDSVDDSTNLAKLGMDSLMATEIIQALHRSYRIDLESEDVRELTISNLKQMK